MMTKIKIHRPSKKAIGEAFGEYTTSCVCGYEYTAWDVMRLIGLDTVIEMFAETDEGVWVIEMFERETSETMQKMIEDYAWRKTK